MCVDVKTLIEGNRKKQDTRAEIGHKGDQKTKRMTEGGKEMYRPNDRETETHAETQTLREP